MTTTTTALAVTIGVLPAFGVTMTAIDRLSRRYRWLEQWVVDRAAVVYTLFLVTATVVAGFVGLLSITALLGPAGPWRWVIAMLLAPIAAVITYLIELFITSKSRTPGMAFAMLIPDAQAAVGALVPHPGQWWMIAVTTAVTEEILFRGALLPAVGHDFGWVAAVAVSALVFGLHHIAFGAPSVIAKTIGGAIWAAMTLLGGGVIAALCSHLCFQALVWRRLIKVGV